MPTQYLDIYIGAKDGTKSPPDRLDGRKVGAKRSSTWGAKPAGVAWALADKILIADLAQGESIRDILVSTDTTLGTTTMDVGTLTVPAKYASAKTLTVVDTPTSIGPKVAASMLGPVTADEDVYVTLGVGGIGAGINVVFETVITSIK